MHVDVLCSEQTTMWLGQRVQGPATLRLLKHQRKRWLMSSWRSCRSCLLASCGKRETLSGGSNLTRA